MLFLKEEKEMSFIRNIKIKVKLRLLVGIACILLLVLATFAYIALNKVASLSEHTYQTISVPTGYIAKLGSAFDDIKVAIRDLGITTDEAENKRLHDLITQRSADLEKYMNDYSDYLAANKVQSGKEYDTFKIITDNYPLFKPVLAKAVSAALANDLDATVGIIQTELVPIGNKLSGAVEEVIDINVGQSSDANDEAAKTRTFALIEIAITIVIAILVLMLFAIIIINAIARPINQMVEVTKNVAKGNLNVNIKVDSTDEMGILASEFSTLVSTLRRLIDDLAQLSKEHEAGDMDAKINEKNYEGSYANLAVGLNAMVKSYVESTMEVLNCVDGFGMGNFDAKLKQYPGKKAVANKMMEQLRTNLKSVSGDIQKLVGGAIDGNLSLRVEASTYKGDWGKIIIGLNEVLDAVAAPIQEASDVMRKMSVGDFSASVTGNYKGDFVLIKNSLNNTITNIAQYINEISVVLSELANNNFDQEIKREYVGDFSTIKIAVNTIVEKLNHVLGEINSATEQVSSGAKQISESSMTLAEGATEQASSVQELSANIDTINEQTSYNVENATKANELSKKSKENATTGNDEMKSMLASMEGIRTSSVNISKIIKVIEDIAFQTNLLALNAAVEAARAGQHGKGFAVVAEEVRNLAARSQTAAKETTELIEDSMSKVNTGTAIATSTASALEKIVTNINEVSSIISEIEVSSKEQANSISQISIGLTQISQVVQRNSATSEEAASAAEEMASQAMTLENMVSIFKLKGR